MDRIELLAQAAHDVNAAYCHALGDTSQVPWTSAPDWQKESAIKGVEGALNGNTPEQSHASWMAEKVATGWTYGEVKDAEKKTHPCMVPYDKLPPDQRAKDAIFVAVVQAADKVGRAAAREMQDAIHAKDAEITTLRRHAHALTEQLTAAQADLDEANNPVHGIAPPAQIADMPTLDQIPPHASLVEPAVVNLAGDPRDPLSGEPERRQATYYDQQGREIDIATGEPKSGQPERS
jgi:hypothetical protein